MRKVFADFGAMGVTGDGSLEDISQHFEDTNDDYYYLANENANSVTDFDSDFSKSVNDELVSSVADQQAAAKKAKMKKMAVAGGLAAGLWFMLK